MIPNKASRIATRPIRNAKNNPAIKVNKVKYLAPCNETDPEGMGRCGIFTLSISISKMSLIEYPNAEMNPAVIHPILMYHNCVSVNGSESAAIAPIATESPDNVEFKGRPRKI